ncbi:hypothetical protein C0991_001399, partial [Blastosporella zonata]
HAPFFTTSSDIVLSKVKALDRINDLGLAYAESIQSLICLPCKIAVASSNIHGHLHHTHKGSGIHATKAEVALLTATLDLLPSLPQPTKESIPAIPGLEVFKVLQCTICEGFYKSVQSMAFHYHKSHPGQSIPKSFSIVNGQRLDNGFHATWFPVIVPEEPSPDPSSPSHIIAQLRTAQKNHNQQPLGHSLDPRRVNPWLQSNNWLDFLKDRDLSALIDYASLPKANEFPRLAEYVQALFLASSDLLDHTPELTLQRINTSDPAKT